MATCVVIASSAEVRRVVEDLLEDLGLDPLPVPSLGELLGVVKDVPVGGILLELGTSIKSSPEEKKAANEIARLYPFARFRVIGEEIRIHGDENSLEEFARRCQRSEPRVIRRETRVFRYLSVYLWRDQIPDDAEKTITINVSGGGCFIYSSRDWAIGDRVWLRMADGETAVSGTVRFWRAWGQNNGVPGIGVKFDVESSWGEAG